MDKPFYKRVLLKLSGEALMGEQEFGISSDVIASYARQIKEIAALHRRCHRLSFLTSKR